MSAPKQSIGIVEGAAARPITSIHLPADRWRFRGQGGDAAASGSFRRKSKCGTTERELSAVALGSKKGKK